MSIDRVSTAAQTAFFLTQIQNAGQALDTVQEQIASGKNANTYAGFGDKVAWDAAPAGFSETDAKARNVAYEKSVFPWAASGRSLANVPDRRGAWRALGYVRAHLGWARRTAAGIGSSLQRESERLAALINESPRMHGLILLASEARMRMPPDSSRGRWPAVPASPTASSARSTRASAAA